MRPVYRAFAVLALIAFGAPPLFGQPAATKSPEASADDAANREAEALAFVRLHHAELRDLLDRLKKHNPGEFEKAVRQIAQTSERLERLRERDPERYRVELELWKVDSRVHLLVARLTMTNDQALVDEIKDLLAERVELRLHQMRLERERLAARVEKLDELIADLDQNQDEAVQKEFDRLTRGLGAPRTKSRGRSVAQPPAALRAGPQDVPSESKAKKTNER